MRHQYETSGKKAVMGFLKEHSDSHFTVEEIIEGLLSEGKKASRSSVYRQISRMYSSGEVRRFESHEKNNFVYQFAFHSNNCEMHYHLKCTECGKLIHMECEKMNDLKNHILTEHGFSIGGEAIINGVCCECSSKAADRTKETDLEK